MWRNGGELSASEPKGTRAMTIASMTGFGASSGQVALDEERVVNWSWEIRSVNGRGADIRLRLPPGYERLDVPLRKHVAARIGRGSMSATLSIETAGGGRSLVLDEKALQSVADALAKVRLLIECAPPSADGILSLKGVLSPADEGPGTAALSTAAAAVETGFLSALDVLITSRKEEGGRLASVLADQLQDMERLVAEARALGPASVDRFHTQLKAQIAELLADADLPPERVAQEAAILATKADIREELDRLDGHIASARALLDTGGVAGRALDFIAQEIVRESNTFTTKVQDMALKRIGLGLKGLVDQFKEQVQNIE